MAGKIRLTQGEVDRLKPRLVDNKPVNYDVWDDGLRGYGVHHALSGRRTYIAYRRWPGTEFPARRPIGDASKMTEKQARKIAKHRLGLAEQGIDYEADERRIKAEADAAKIITFKSVAEDYIAQHLKNLKRDRVDAREITRDVIPAFGGLGIKEVTRDEVIEMAQKIAKRAPAVARLALNHTSRIFTWALNQPRKRYKGLEAHPLAFIKPRSVFGSDKPIRFRTLNDAELRALWAASDVLGYPIGPCVKLIALTGCRLNEIAQIRRSELDLDKGTLTISAERFKSGVPNLVQLTKAAVKVINDEVLPALHGTSGENDTYIFTSFKKDREGRNKSINGWSQAKVKLDTLMVEAGLTSDPSTFTFHDVRRTVRSRLSALKVKRHVAEMVIGHGKKGLDRVYDQHEYADEIRAALTKWERALMEIIRGPVKLSKAA